MAQVRPPIRPPARPLLPASQHRSLVVPLLVLLLLLLLVAVQRNYPCLNTIATYFGALPNWNATGEAAFRQQLYLCQLGQALEMKSDIEAR